VVLPTPPGPRQITSRSEVRSSALDIDEEVAGAAEYILMWSMWPRVDLILAVGTAPA
jgi:hypothetical protein